MKTISIILGIILTVFGISMIFTPIATFLSTGYFFAIMLLICGIMGMITNISLRNYGINFIFAIISAVLGIIMAVAPSMQLFADEMLLYIMACWFVLQGIVSIFIAIKAKKDENKQWGWILAIGIIGLIVGIYTLFHPLILAMTLGILIGVYFIESGINMIIIACENKA